MHSGIINVYKEPGYTSFDVVARLRGILGIRKIGHTGTLDPAAKGVLPVCVGKGTKLVDLLTEKDKCYEAVFLLGVETDTYDTTGSVLSENEVKVSAEDVRTALKGFVGDIMQIPPMYSALKVDGKKLYELARKGIEVERAARPVKIFSIDVLSVDLPRITLSIHCGSGTYIRSIAHDLGVALGCGCAMESLIRTKVSDYNINDALTLDEIADLVKAGDFSFIHSIDSALYGQRLCVKEEYLKEALNGAKLGLDYFLSNVSKDEERYLVYLPDGRFLGAYEMRDDRLVIRQMFLE